MKIKKIFMFCIGLSFLMILVACSEDNKPVDMGQFSEKSTGDIYLYGERPGVSEIVKKELEIWDEYYHEEDMRHLFVQLPYYTAEFLNIWMESDNNNILDEVYKDWKDTEMYNTWVKEFYIKVKKDYPETIFHGTDIGLHYYSTGERYLKYLEENDLVNTEKYTLAQEAIEQGEYYYKDYNKQLYDGYRENKMVENFIREFDKLENENIMGIYNVGHIGFNGIAYNKKSLPNMGNQLSKRYDGSIYSKDLSNYTKDKDIEALRKDTITINNKDYEAFYFGKVYWKGYRETSYSEFWRLENAYEDFKDNKNTRDFYLPCETYPMVVGIEEVFVVDFVKTDGRVERKYYRSDGIILDDEAITEAIKVK